ncbi:MAG: CRISPR-associated helicase Cas3' [Oscillospiraceae bacterium]
MDYIAHRDPATGREQSVLEHLTATAEKASAFAGAFSAYEAGYACGLLHDIGKYSNAFQKRICGATERPDHATAGALEAIKLRNVPAAFCIGGHHSGLPDLGIKKAENPHGSTFYDKACRVPGKDIEDYSAFTSELELPETKFPPKLLADNESSFFFTRMLYSCLVDADFLDTEAFMSNGAVERHCGESLELLSEKLTAHMASKHFEKTDLNDKRASILQTLINSSSMDSGLFTLTVPTGGGKTIGSMAFALRHAIAHGKNRVIYVIPYTSIIEQTQTVFEEIFGAENVVAHYANVDYNTDEYGKITDSRYLASENWDAPIILTTIVQFFESLYANRSSRCRKLHNIANSVIIFDEAQMLPIPYLTPCISAISQLIKNYGCSAVLCTATQPALNKLFEKSLPNYPARELCPEVAKMHEAFRRVRYEKVGKLSDEALAMRLNSETQVLCIVNNRKQAQAVFSMLDGEACFHLSTTMYPSHRRKILAEIRRLLHEKLPCRVVSTSLVEAGVDLNFPCVYRALAGLDSMLQAGGRCNREGKNALEESFVYLFETETKPPQMIRQNIAAAEHVMRNFDDISSPEAVNNYFNFLLYTLKDNPELDSKEILRDIVRGAMPFASVANKFHIIENSEFTVYIPLEDGAELVSQLEKFGESRSLMRKLGQFAVGVYPQHFKELVQLGAVESIGENTAVLRDISLYNEQTGLSFFVKEGQGFLV